MADDARAPGKGRLRIPLECVLFAGLGGAMPSLARYASALSAGSATSAPTWGFSLGVALFFVMGSVIAYVLCPEKLPRGKMLQQAFALGLAAPGIIMSWGSGRIESTAVLLAPQAEEEPVLSVSASPGAVIIPFLPIAHAGEPAAGKRHTGPSLLVRAQLAGVHARQVEAVPITIRFLGKDGEAIGGKTLSLAGSKSLRLPVPESSRKVEFVAQHSTRTVPLPQGPFETATVRYQVRVKGKIGFWWALGSRRQAEVLGASASLLEQRPRPQTPRAPQRPSPELSPRQALDVQVKDADGRIIGRVEEVKIGRDADVVLIRTPDGKTRDLPMHRLKKTGDGLRRER